MPLTSLGDMARHFTGLRDMTALRSRLTMLGGDIGSLQVSDTTRHLQGRGDRLVALDHKIAALGTEQKIAEALGQRLKTAQVALTTVESQRATLSQQLTGLPTAVTAKAMAQTGAQAESALRDIFGALSVQHGSDHVFSGRDVDKAPLGSVDALLADLRGLAAGATSLDALRQVADFVFNDPAGPFATATYRGETGSAETRDLGQSMTVALGPRADDPALRAVFTELATAILIAETDVGAAAFEQSFALQEVGARLVGTAEDLAILAARLGGSEQLVEQVATSRGAALTAATMMRNQMVGVDEAKTISDMQQVQAQLEIQYTVTARLASLSLAGYLR